VRPVSSPEPSTLCTRCRTPIRGAASYRVEDEPTHRPGECPTATDGGREMVTQPETCPECGLTLTADGECRTGGCPGPDDE
jgi:hypothetical protein